MRMARTGGNGVFAKQKPEKSSDNGCNVPFMPAETLSDGKKRKSNKNRLRVRRVVHVPLREVSGICLGRSDNGRMFLIAVGDRAAKIAWFSLSHNDRGRIDWHTSSIAKLAGSELPKHDPQIEAVCADGAGFEVPKGYIYAAIGFSVGVETLNQFAARRRRYSDP